MISGGGLDLARRYAAAVSLVIRAASLSFAVSMKSSSKTFPSRLNRSSTSDSSILKRSSPQAGRGAHRVRGACGPQSPCAPRHPTLPPKSLMLPGKPARGDAHDLLRAGDGGADHLRRAAVSFEDRKRALGGGLIDHVAKADAHVEHLVHLAVVDAGVALDEGEDGMRLDEPVDLVADRGGDAGEVEEAVAGDVDQRLHPGNLRQDLHRLGNVDVGRAQELLAERHGELVELVADGVAVVGEERLAREREAVAVDAAALDADDDVAFPHA